MTLRIYLDTAPIIYLVEKTDGLGAQVERRLAVPEAIIVSSDLARLECRVKPIRESDDALLGAAMG